MLSLAELRSACLSPSQRQALELLWAEALRRRERAATHSGANAQAATQ